MTALGAKAFPDDPAARAKSDADANDFLGDLRKWTAATDQADSRDEEEPTFIGGEAGAPIRGASRVRARVRERVRGPGCLPVRARVCE